MAKKKFKLNIKQTAAIGISGIVIVTLLGIFGIEIGFDTLPFLPSGAYDIDNFPSIDQATELNNANLGEQAKQVFLETPNCEGATNDDFLNANPDLPEQCDQEEELKKIIEMQMPINNSTIPMNNTSQTPPPEQLCDIDPENILCQIINPPTSSLNLLSSITKTDSIGNEFFVEGAFAVPQLSFLVEDTTNIDFATGNLNIKLKLNSELANQEYFGSCTNPTFQPCVGKFDLLIGEQSIFTEPIDLGIGRTGDVNGDVGLIFLTSPTSGSEDFTFFFNENLNRFTNEGVSTITIKIIELNVGQAQSIPETMPSDLLSFSMLDQVIFTMDIARDDEQIIITDEEGITTRLFPTDSKLILTSIPVGVSGVICFIWSQTTANNAERTTSTSGDRNAPLVAESCVSTVISSIPVGTAPPPQLSGIIILDQDGQLLLNLPGGGGTGTTSIRVLDELVTRNQNYTLKISSPVFDSALSFGKSQETQSYTCQYNPVATYTAENQCVTPTGCFGGCATHCYIAIRPSGFTNNEITCTLP